MLQKIWCGQFEFENTRKYNILVANFQPNFCLACPNKNYEDHENQFLPTL